MRQTNSYVQSFYKKPQVRRVLYVFQYLLDAAYVVEQFNRGGVVARETENPERIRVKILPLDVLGKHADTFSSQIRFETPSMKRSPPVYKDDILRPKISVKLRARSYVENDRADDRPCSCAPDRPRRQAPASGSQCKESRIARTRVADRNSKKS